MPGKMQVQATVIVANGLGQVDARTLFMPAPWEVVDATEYTGMVLRLVADTQAFRERPLLTTCSVIVVTFWKGKTKIVRTDTHGMYHDLSNFFGWKLLKG